MDPYKTLGISPSATDEQVTAAYRSLARKYHPDLNPGDKVAEEKMKEVNGAYEMIKEMRAKGESYTNAGNSYYGSSASGSGQSQGGQGYGYGPYGQNGPYGQSGPYTYNRQYTYSTSTDDDDSSAYIYIFPFGFVKMGGNGNKRQSQTQDQNQDGSAKQSRPKRSFALNLLFSILRIVFTIIVVYFAFAFLRQCTRFLFWPFFI